MERSRLTGMKLLSVVAASLAAFMIGSTIPASPASEPAIQVLQRIPPDVLAIAYPSNPIPASKYSNGLVSVNMNGWEYVGEQRNAMIPIVNGAVRGDAALVDKYFPAIDQAFAHQLPDGSFDYMHVINGVTVNPAGVPNGSAFFIADSAEALLLLQQSSLGPRYQTRINALMPKYRAALAWLARPTNVQYMLRSDYPADNRYFVDAAAFILGDALAGSSEARARGDQILGIALSRQSPAGWFPEHAGGDSSYNAVSMRRIMEIALFDNDPRLQSAVERALPWELSRIRDSGEVDVTGNTRTGGPHVAAAGNPYTIDYMEITRMFALAGALYGNSQAMGTAQRIASFHRANPTQNMGWSAGTP